MKRIHVGLEAGRGYDILIGHDVLKNFGKRIRALDLGDNIFLITSPRIGNLYLQPLLKSLKSAGYRDVKVSEIPDGERYKSDASHRRLLKSILDIDKNQNKRLLIVNLGGGVIGDLGGYVASIYRRGTDYIQVPTTLLAFVDCGIGGKVGINFNGIKNIVGSFHQPRLVYADLNLLNTLSKREIRSGLAEVVKHGIITSYSQFEFIEENVANLFSLNRKVIDQIVTDNYSVKARIVERDEFDTKGIRATLNYGHTIGHAVEAASHYAYRHGEAVSIGMVCVNDIAVKIGLLDRNIAARIENLLVRIGLPVSIKNCETADIMTYFWRDKKFLHGKNRLVFITDIGKTRILEGIPVAVIRSVVEGRLMNTR